MDLNKSSPTTYGRGRFRRNLNLPRMPPPKNNWASFCMNEQAKRHLRTSASSSLPASAAPYRPAPLAPTAPSAPPSAHQPRSPRAPEAERHADGPPHGRGFGGCFGKVAVAPAAEGTVQRGGGGLPEEDTGNDRDHTSNAVMRGSPPAEFVRVVNMALQKGFMGVHHAGVRYPSALRRAIFEYAEEVRSISLLKKSSDRNFSPAILRTQRMYRRCPYLRNPRIGIFSLFSLST